MYGTSAQSARKRSPCEKASGSGFIAGSLRHAARVRQRFSAILSPSVAIKRLYAISLSSFHSLCPDHAWAVGVSILLLASVSAGALGFAFWRVGTGRGRAEVGFGVDKLETASNPTIASQLRLFIWISVILDLGNGRSIRQKK